MTAECDTLEAEKTILAADKVDLAADPNIKAAIKTNVFAF